MTVEPMQLASMLATAVGIFALVVGVGLLRRDRNAAALAEIADDFVFGNDEGTPLLERFFRPMKDRFSKLGKTFTPRSALDKMRRHAVLAGLGAGGMESVLATRAIGTAVGATVLPLIALVAGADFGRIMLFALPGGAVGFFLPGLWVSRLGRKRQQAIRVDLPETIDLMAIAVQAGMGLEAAIELASQTLPGLLGDELYRLLQEIQLGSSRRQALHQLRDRTEVSELSSFALALIQADAIGSPIADVLQSNAARMRLIRRQVAREKAAKLPVKLLVPMLLFIFPALFVVVVGPAAISIVTKVFGAV